MRNENVNTYINETSQIRILLTRILDVIDTMEENTAYFINSAINRGRRNPRYMNRNEDSYRQNDYRTRNTEYENTMPPVSRLRPTAHYPPTRLASRNPSFSFVTQIPIISDLSNERLGLTNYEIEQNTTIIRYSSSMSDINTMCPISRELFIENQEIMQINRCGHCFNKDCLRIWFNNHKTCPLCRQNVTQNDISGNIV